MMINIYFNDSRWAKYFLRIFLLVMIGGLNIACDQNRNRSQSDNKSLDLPKLKRSSQEPLNIIYVLTDDQRYDDIGFLDHPFLETPYMDSIAKNGFHFSNANVTTSLCSPSRASILTGMYAHKHEAVNNKFPLKKGTVFFPEYLQEAGYQTGFLGKWHMGYSSAEPRPGFDYWLSFRGQGVYFNPTINENGKKIEYKDSTYITDLLTQKTINFLDERDKERPFFLYLSHKAVHGMWRPAPRHKGRYQGATPSDYLPIKDKAPKGTSQPAESINKEDLPMWVKNQRNSWHGAEFPLYNPNENSVQQYYEDMSETLLGVDESLGQIIEYLHKNRLMDNTMIIYMSDNGFQYGSHGLFDKRVSYEGSIRVPLLIYNPKLKENAGTEIDQLVANIDISPTILEAAGLKSPSEMDGRSLFPLMKGQTENWRDYMLYEYYWENNHPQTPTQFALKGKKYKYITYYGIWDTNEELYDYQKDPNEHDNLIRKPAYKNIVDKMNNKLFNILKETRGMDIPLYPNKGGGQNLRDINIKGSKAAEFPSHLLVDPDTINQQ